MTAPVAVVFFGSGPFAVPILDALRAMPGIVVVGVVSVPDRPAGRRARLTAPPVASLARSAGLPLLQPARLRGGDAAAALSALHAEVAVLADYGRLVPRDILGIPKRGFLSLHPSLLPRHRGATPIQATILEGDPGAGVTLFEMDAGLDTGPIVAQVAWPLAGNETAPELESDAAVRAAALLRASLGPWLAGALVARPQPSEGATLTRPLDREVGRLDPQAPAAVLERRVRALSPWPGTFLETPAGRLAVLRAEVARSDASDEPGLVVADGRGLALATRQDRLRLLEVRPSGGRAMTGADLRNGRPGWLGSRVVAS